MAKTVVRSAADNFVIAIFFILVSLALLSPLWVFKDLLFPFITSKAFMFRAFVEAALPFYVFLLVKRKDFRPSWRNPLLLAMGAFLLFNFAASLTGVNQNRSLWGNFERMGGTYYLAHLMLLAMYVVLLAQIGGKHIKYILYVVFGIAAFITLNGVSGWLHGPIIVPDPSLPSRVSSTLGNPIFLGSYLILPMFLAAFFALQEETRAKKIVFWLITALFFAGVILSVTRGALVGLVAGITLGGIIYIIFNSKQEVRLYGSVVVVLGVLAMGSLYFFNNRLPENRLTRLFQLQGGSTQARFMQWKAAWKGFEERPVLGVGPENYYFISNKFYDPNMVKYDPSWFDKPHNYILEVLATTGTLGFASYMAVVVLAMWALYRSYRVGFLTLLQMCVLLAGFASYFVQNLFVFDTIPASMMFYVFVGFAAYLWNEVSSVSGKSPQATPALGSGSLATASFLVTAAVSAYAVYVTNIVPAQAAKNINYGYAYAGTDPVKAQAYFQDAVNSPFNFDKQDTGQRYSDLAQAVAQSQKLDPETAKKIVGDIVEFQKGVAQSIGNDPVSWQKLASDYYMQAVVNQTNLNPLGEAAIKQAISLVPNRIEPEIFYIQILIAQNRLEDANKELDKINSAVPLVPYTANTRWLKAYVSRLLGRNDEAAALANQLVADGYQPAGFQIIGWIYDYYSGKKDYETALVWAERLAVKWFPNESSAHLALAEAYSKTGKIEQARSVLQNLIATNSPNKAEAQAMLEALPK